MSGQGYPDGLDTLIGGNGAWPEWVPRPAHLRLDDLDPATLDAVRDFAARADEADIAPHRVWCFWD